MNCIYTVHNSKNCLPKSTNAGKKKKKKKSRKRELINVDAEPKRSHSCIDNNLDLYFYYFKLFISPTFQEFLDSGILLGPKIVEKGISNSNKFNKEIL